MKKFLKITAVVIVLILGALILIPVIYKDKLVELVKDEANRKLNAELDFAEIDLTFFRHFPELTLAISDLKLSGVDHFEGVDLIRVGEFELTLGLGSVLSGDLPSIESVYIDDADIYALVHPSGAANWDIAKETEAEAEAEAEEEAEAGAEAEAEAGANFQIHLKRYVLEDINIEYLDEHSHMHLKIEDLDHEGSGDFDAESFRLNTISDLDNLFLEYEDEVLIDQWEVEAKIDLDVNMLSLVYTLSENEIRINDLLLKADGRVMMPDSSIGIDLRMSAPSLDLKQLLSLAPASSDLDAYEFGGESSLDIWVKGEYNDHSYPLFALDIAVKDGSFHYQDLPRSAEDIEVRAHVESPSSNDLDQLWVDISRFDMNLGGNPLSAAFSLRKPMSVMDFTSRFSASIDFETLKDVLPPEEYSIHQGVLKANLSAEGSLAELEAENYEGLKASGKLAIQEMVYDYMDIQKVLMNFDLDKVGLETAQLKIGASDFSASGELENFIPYALYEKELKGRLSLRSKMMDIDELMQLSGAEAEAEAEVEAEAEAEAEAETDVVMEAQSEVASVDSVVDHLPKNIHFEMDVLMDRIIYEEIELSELKGKMRLKDGILSLMDCSTNTLGGTLLLDGYLDESVEGKPLADFDFRAKELSIKESADKITSIEKYFPVAKYAKGNYSGNFKLRSELDAELYPVYSTLYSKGGIQTSNMKIEGFKAFDTFAALTKTENFLDDEFEDIDISYEIIDGVAYIKPFDFAVDQLSGNASGTVNLDQQVDFDVHMKVPSAALGEGANEIMGQVAGLLSGIGVETEVPENIEMDIKITGPAEDPVIRPNFSGVSSGTAKEIVTEKINEEIDKAKEEAKAKAAEEAEKILAEAQKEADKILKEAQKNIDLLKEEGYAQADKLVSDAKGFVEKAAAKLAAAEMKKQIDKQAENLMIEAQKQADKVLSDAQKQADRLKN